MAQALKSASIAASSFVGSVECFGVKNGARVVARSSLGGKAKQVAKQAGKQASKTLKKSSGAGADRPLWFPGAQAPEWLDGSLPGDYGFDPLSLGKSPEYLQVELDSLNQNLAKNEAGDVIGTRISKKEEIAPTPFQPYSEVFGLQRFRECELIHGRWAMLAILGALSVEAFTGVTWQDAGKVELVDGASYFGLPLPFSITSLVYIEAFLVGFIEFQRNAELDPEKRLYPGGKFFDPLNFADTEEKKETLKLAEIKHARLAMVAALGFAAQAAATGKGPLDNWATHLADPLHTTIFDTFSK
jgi:light-harvesting complex II chlorophyll a/b binding protein 4